MRRAVLVVAVLFLLVGARSAAAANADVTIAPGGVLAPDPVTITEGDTVTWKNNDVSAHTIYLEGTKLSGSIDPGKSYTSPPLAKGTLHYGLAADDKSATIQVKAAPVTTTTTTTVKPTTTTSSTPSTTTTTAPTTTTSSSTTTTTSSTTTTTSLATVPVNNSSGGGGSSAALLLGIAAVVVAGLAGAAYWAWSRSDEPPYDDGPPPTTSQPSI